MKSDALFVPNPRIGLYYALGAAALTPVALLTYPWGLLLAWPVLSMIIVALAYGWLGPGIYGKRNGRIPLFRQILLAPTRLGQFLSLLHYRRQCDPWNAVVPGVLIGSLPTRTGVVRLADEGVSHVLDLTAEFSEHPALRGEGYRNIPLLDLTAPTPGQLDKAVQWIRECQSGNAPVLVHCKSGYSRSAAVVGAYLLAEGVERTVDEAIARMRAVRPSIVIRPEVRRAIERFSSEGFIGSASVGKLES